MMDQNSGRFSEFPNDPNKITMSAEEMAIFKECNQEALMKRGIPFASVFMAGTYYALKTGFLKPNPSLGYLPALGFAGLIGCITGSFSYKAHCIQKILALPNSTLKQQIDNSMKKREYILATSKGPHLQEDPRFEPQSQMASGLQMDTYQSSNDFDGFTGVNTDDDQPSHFDLLEPLDKFGGGPTTYDELRQKNRDDYYRSRPTIRLLHPSEDPRFSRPQAPISDGFQSFDRDRVPQYQLVD